MLIVLRYLLSTIDYSPIFIKGSFLFIALICIINQQLLFVGPLNATYVLDGGSPGSCAGLPRLCYSCASTRFKKRWTTYSAFFQKPRNFTEYCDPPVFRLKAPTAECIAPCLTLIEPIYVFGQEVAQAYFRGCFDKFFTLRRIEDVALERLMHSGETCRTVPRNVLFGQNNFNDNITLCSCVCDKCNIHPDILHMRSSSLSPSKMSLLDFAYYIAFFFLSQISYDLL